MRRLGGGRKRWRREKEVEEREKVVGRREREVQEREEKIVALEQAIDERRQALDQRGSKLEEHSKQVGSSRKNWKHVLLNLVVSTRPLQHLVQIHGPLPFFGLLSFMCWVTGRLRSSFALALPPPLTQVLPPPTWILPLPPPPLPQPPLKEDPDVTGKLNAIYTSQQVDGGVTLYS